MDEKSWNALRVAIEEEDQEVSTIKVKNGGLVEYLNKKVFYLLVYTQAFETAEELFNNGMIDGKPFIERVKDFE